MGKKTITGLRLRGETWHVQKQVKGFGLLCESCGTSSRTEAERYLIRRLEEIRQAIVYGVRPNRKWRDAATKYLNEHLHLASIGDNAMHLEQLDPFIGDLWMHQVHMGTLKRFIDARYRAGISPKSINNALGVVRRILRLGEGLWRDEVTDLTWIEKAPMIVMETLRGRQSKPYPLSRPEWAALSSHLPSLNAEMAMFALHTGRREQEVCGLRWDWEVKVPEMDASVFIVPGNAVGRKNGEDSIVVLNRVASSIVESRRGRHPEYVFTYRRNRKKRDGTVEIIEAPVGKMNNTAWKRAWRKAGLPVEPGVRRGVHNLRHTCGRWLRAAGVGVETRKAILGHKSVDITTHYSLAEILELLNALNLMCDEAGKWGKTGAVTLLRKKAVAA